MNPRVVEVISNRANHAIDPHLHIWEWQIPAYLFLGGVVAGIMFLLAAMEIRRGERPTSVSAQVMPFVAAALLSLGMLFLLLDLEHPAHVYRFYMAFEPTSPMSWGSWILLLVYPALILLGLGALDGERREALGRWPVVRKLERVMTWAYRLADGWRRPVLWVTAALGAGLGVYTGLLLGTMTARPMWTSSVLGPLFLVSGISTGAAAMMLTRLSEEEAHVLVRWDSLAIALELVLLAALVMSYVTGPEAGRQAGAMILGGAYTQLFWGVVVVAGLLAPLLLNLVELGRKIPGTRFAPALILIGGLALRVVFVAAGQLVSFAGVS